MQKPIQNQPVIVPQEPVKVPQQKMPIGRIIGSLGILVILLSGLLFFFGPPPSAENLFGSAKNGVTVLPTPFPFEEMTIPYLRKQKYDSKLGSLEEIGNNGNYTSYLTSYQSDGLKVNGLLTVPNSETLPFDPTQGKDYTGEKYPAIVFIHGYIPPTLYTTTEKYVDYVDYLARNGYVVFKIDLRGHGESEGTPGGGYYGSDYITDALNAYSALQHTAFVDAKKVGMWGHSMAGNILLRSVAVKPEILAVVIWAGAVYSYEDQRKYGIQDNSYRPPQTSTQTLNRRRELFEKVGSPSASSPFWQQVAPTNFLSDLKGAIQLNHAVNDEVVNIGYSRDLNALLDKTSVPHELHEYPSGGHNIEGSSFVVAMENTLRFYNEHLK